MGRKRLQPEDVAKSLATIDSLIARGWSIGEAVKALGATESTYFRWCAERETAVDRVGEQSRRVRQLEAESARLRLALADNRLDQLLLRRLARATF